MPRFTVTLRTFLGAASHPAAPEAFALVGVGRTRPAAFAQARAALLDACHAAGMGGRAYPACRIGEIDTLFASACDTMGRKRPGAPACPRAFAESASKAQSVEIERHDDAAPAAAACTAPRDASVSAPAEAEHVAPVDVVPVSVAPAPRHLHPGAAAAIREAYNGHRNIMTPAVLGFHTCDGLFAIEFSQGEGFRDRVRGVCPPIYGVTVVHLRSNASDHNLSRMFCDIESARLYVGKLELLARYRQRRKALMATLAQAEAAWLSALSLTDAADAAAVARHTVRANLAHLRAQYRTTLARFGCEPMVREPARLPPTPPAPAPASAEATPGDGFMARRGCGVPRAEAEAARARIAAKRAAARAAARGPMGPALPTEAECVAAYLAKRLPLRDVTCPAVLEYSGDSPAAPGYLYAFGADWGAPMMTVHRVAGGWAAWCEERAEMVMRATLAEAEADMMAPLLGHDWQAGELVRCVRMALGAHHGESNIDAAWASEHHRTPGWAGVLTPDMRRPWHAPALAEVAA